MTGKTGILLIEDDRELGRQVVERLERSEYSVLWIDKGRLIENDDLRGIVLVIVDLMLPGVAGLDIIKHLRSYSDIPVLVLSAKNDTGDKVRALQLGADDYMTKPFWPEELLERLRARLRRPSLQRDGIVDIGALRIDRARREVFIEGRAVDLTRLEFDFLDTLATRAGQAVSRQALAQKILDPESEADERTLDAHVSRLRKKLGATGIVETVWGIGYRLAVPSPA